MPSFHWSKYSVSILTPKRGDCVGTLVRNLVLYSEFHSEKVSEISQSVW